jgi:lactoylglutathione lyase
MVKYWGSVIYVEDVPAALRFYEQAFGFTTRFYDEEAGFGELEVGDAVFAFATHTLGKRLMPEHYEWSENELPSRIEIAFVTDDVPGAFRRAVEAGAVSVTEPTVMPWGATIAYLRSIEGTLIGLTTPMR